jgi:hypothetical protein
MAKLAIIYLSILLVGCAPTDDQLLLKVAKSKAQCSVLTIRGDVNDTQGAISEFSFPSLVATAYHKRPQDFSLIVERSSIRLSISPLVSEWTNSESAAIVAYWPSKLRVGNFAAKYLAYDRNGEEHRLDDPPIWTGIPILDRK